MHNIHSTSSSYAERSIHTTIFFYVGPLQTSLIYLDFNHNTRNSLKNLTNDQMHSLNELTSTHIPIKVYLFS